MQKELIVIGLIILILGIMWPIFSDLKLGSLPGDIIIRKWDFTFYFPIVTSIIISLLVTLIMWFIRK